MDKVTEAKNEFRKRQWAQIIQNCQESGITVVAWCKQNNVKIKSYYYWLRRIRSIACESSSMQPSVNNPQIVPVSLRQQKQSAAVTIHLPSVSVDIYNGAARETIETVIAELKSIC